MSQQNLGFNMSNVDVAGPGAYGPITSTATMTQSNEGYGHGVGGQSNSGFNLSNVDVGPGAHTGPITSTAELHQSNAGGGQGYGDYFGGQSNEGFNFSNVSVAGGGAPWCEGHGVDHAPAPITSTADLDQSNYGGGSYHCGPEGITVDPQINLGFNMSNVFVGPFAHTGPITSTADLDQHNWA